MIGRREFITLLGGASLAWPLAARAQQTNQKRRIGVLMNQVANDPEGLARVTAFAQGLQEAGWAIGRNLQVDYRWAAGNSESVQKYAAELVELAPEAILATGGFSVGPLLHLTKTIPIVFVSVTDPLGSGFITSISRPGRNATGFTNFEYSMSAKWLELLKQVAPSVKRAVVIRNPGLTSGGGQFGAIQAVSTFLGIEVIPVDARNVEDIERSVTKLAHEGHGGLIVTADPAASIHRELIISMTARNKLPTVFPFRYWVVNGGLISYGPDALDYYRRAASYIDRILKGEKPADLPVQAPTKYETVLNLKTAKALGLDIPASVLARADEVIE